MDGDMFCFIYEGGLVKVDDGTIPYIGGRTFSLEIDKHMSYGDFRSRVYALLNMRPELVKFEFIVKFDPSSLIVLFDDASYASMLRWNDVYCRVYVFSIERLSPDIIEPEPMK